MFPTPVQGLVVRYSYLWRSEYERGRDDGVKDRPCAVILVTTGGSDARIVTVLPITHVAPRSAECAVEIPIQTKQRLGLDGERSWVVLSEANRFTWPGPDLRPVGPGAVTGVAYGVLPYRLMNDIRLKFLALIRERQVQVVPRTE